MEKDVVLASTAQEKDLGVIVDSGLTFSEHIATQVNKANRILGLIRRSFEWTDKDTVKTLYKSLVRPHLEYCNAVAFPRFAKDVKLLESVQRRATKLVPQLRELPYTERLKALDLSSLEYRRQQRDLIEAYKFMQGKYKVPSPPLKVDTSYRVTRGHDLRVSKQRCQKNIRQDFFALRVTDHWNNLPADIVLSHTVNTFKNRLDKFMSAKRYQFN